MDPLSLCFVTVWKSRVWFVEKNSARAWYLPAGQITGAATQLNLDRAAQFHQGGELVGLWNWTLDGGQGIDDFLVAVSRGGDVAVYQGTDPASATTFALKGTWNAGAMVSGRRIATSFGGDVLLLTKSGLRPLSQLVSGGDGMETYTTAKIANLFNSLSIARSELPGWAVHLHPEDNSLIITVPTVAGANTEQLVYSLWAKSWSRYRDLLLLSACVWKKKLYMGNTRGTVCVNDGYQDDRYDGATSTAVSWSVLTPFTPGDGRQVQVQLIQATVVADQAGVSHKAEARYGFDLREIDAVVDAGWFGKSTWGTGAPGLAVWDTATWVGDLLPTRSTGGATGLGTEVAIAVRGRAISRTVLVNIRVMYKQGGLL